MFNLNKYLMEVSETRASDGEPIEYMIDVMIGDYPKGTLRTSSMYINLTQSGQWVSRAHLKDDDVRLTVLEPGNVELFSETVQPTPDEKMTMLLMGKKWEIEGD